MKKNTGIRRVVMAGFYSMKGLVATFRHEAAFRQELVLAMFMIPVAVILDVTQVERVVLISSVVIVLVVELLNSAIEAVVDRVGEEWHDLSGRAKDMGSAAVLLSLCLCVFTWVAIVFLTDIN